MGRLDHFRHVRAIRSAFERSSLEQPSFAPEAEVAARILEVMETPGVDAPARLRALLASLDGTEHYDGTGWLDLRMAVEAWIRCASG